MPVQGMTKAELRSTMKAIERESKRFDETFRRWMPTDDRLTRFMAQKRQPDEVWRNNRMMAMVFRSQDDGPALARITVQRTALDAAGQWVEGITWDELQKAKNECGFPTHDAVEVFPAEVDVVNVANMRHLWVMREPLAFAWRRD